MPLRDLYISMEILQIYSIPLVISSIAIIITLLYASYRDYKERRVAFKTWYPMLVIGVPIALYTYAALILSEPRAAVGYIILVAVFCAMFYFSSAYLHIFGGADAWAFIFITFLVPLYPILPLTGFPAIAFFPLTVMINAVILNLIVPIGLLIYNLAKKNRAPLFCLLTCYPVASEKLTDSFGFIMEEFEECPKSAEAPEGFKRRFLTFGASIKRMVGGTRRMYTGDLKRNPQEYKKELALYKKAGHVWISYGVPFIIPITAGFVTALVFGDILFTIIRCITGAM